MCSPERKEKKKSSRNKRIMYKELNSGEQQGLIWERDVRACVFMRVETVKVHWTGLSLLTLTGGELLKKKKKKIAPYFLSSLF